MPSLTPIAINTPCLTQVASVPPAQEVVSSLVTRNSIAKSLEYCIDFLASSLHLLLGELWPKVCLMFYGPGSHYSPSYLFQRLWRGEKVVRSWATRLCDETREHQLKLLGSSIPPYDFQFSQYRVSWFSQLQYSRRDIYVQHGCFSPSNRISPPKEHPGQLKQPSPKLDRAESCI